MQTTPMFSRYELIIPELDAAESYRLVPGDSLVNHNKFAILTFALSDYEKPSGKPESSNLFQSLFVRQPSEKAITNHKTTDTSLKRNYSDFSIDRFLTKSSRDVTKEKLAEAEKTFNELKLVIEKYPEHVTKRFETIENQIIVSYLNLLAQINDSRMLLLNELDSYQETCIRNINMQHNIRSNLYRFIDDHQIDTKIIYNYFGESLLNRTDESLREIKDFRDILFKKKLAFNSLLSMNKKVCFKPAFLDFRRIQQGILNCFDFTESDQIPLQFDRLEEFVLSRENASVLNGFIIDNMSIKTQPHEAKIFSLDDARKILVYIQWPQNDSESKKPSELHTFDFFGNLIKSTSVPTTMIIKKISNNASCFLITHTSTDTGPATYFLTCYNPDLEIIRQVQIGNSTKLIPICSYFTDKNFFLLSRRDSMFLSSLTFLHVYDTSLNLLTKIGQSLNPHSDFFVPISTSDIFVKESYLYLLERLAGNETRRQITVIDINSGASLKILHVPFDFDQFYIVDSNLILFLNGSKLICYDMNRENVKYRVELVLEEKMSIQAYCLTKQGFIVVIDKNIVSVY